MELFRCTTGLGTKLVLLEALLGPSLASISDSCLKQESPQTKLPTSANLYSIKQLQIHHTLLQKSQKKTTVLVLVLQDQHKMSLL
jgi:hypothetical protein